MVCAGALRRPPSRRVSSIRIIAARRPICGNALMLSRFREFGWLKGLGDGQQHQRVLRARSRYRAGVAIHALVIADPQGDRPQAERLLALVDALAAAVALFFVDDVL